MNVPTTTIATLEKARSAAEGIGIELIPLVMQFGYSNSLLQNNPNLAAGLPVKDCEFIAQDRQLVVASAPNVLDGGGFESATRNAPAGWDWIDGFGTMTELDSNVKHSGGSALLMHEFGASQNSGGNCRIVKKVLLKPFHEYRLSMWVKTESLRTDEFKFMPLSAGEQPLALSHKNLGVKPTQDWTQHCVVFNSLQQTEVNIYLGLWGAKSGRVWMDDVQLEMVGGVNLLRREGCPIHVVSQDATIEYQEGRDFQRWEDPLLGCVPYLGEYEDHHACPTHTLDH